MSDCPYTGTTIIQKIDWGEVYQVVISLMS